jgi:hypothetical protein
MNGNRGDEDADEEDPNVNVDNSVDDCNGEEDNGYSEGVEFDGDESDYGYSEDLCDRDNTIVDDDVHEDSDTINEDSDTINEATDSDQNPEDLFIIDDVDDIVKVDMFNLDNNDVSKLEFGNLVVA